MLHGNVSQNGYGNAIIGRYGGCFEKDIMRLTYERAYHHKDFDAPAKFAPTLEVKNVTPPVSSYSDHLLINAKSL